MIYFAMCQVLYNFKQLYTKLAVFRTRRLKFKATKMNLMNILFKYDKPKNNVPIILKSSFIKVNIKFK